VESVGHFVLLADYSILAGMVELLSQSISVDLTGLREWTGGGWGFFCIFFTLSVLHEYSSLSSVRCCLLHGCRGR